VPKAFNCKWTNQRSSSPQVFNRQVTRHMDGHGHVWSAMALRKRFTVQKRVVHSVNPPVASSRSPCISPSVIFSSRLWLSVLHYSTAAADLDSWAICTDAHMWCTEHKRFVFMSARSHVSTAWSFKRASEMMLVWRWFVDDVAAAELHGDRTRSTDVVHRVSSMITFSHRLHFASPSPSFATPIWFTSISTSPCDPITLPRHRWISNRQVI